MFKKFILASNAMSAGANLMMWILSSKTINLIAGIACAIITILLVLTEG